MGEKEAGSDLKTSTKVATHELQASGRLFTCNEIWLPVSARLREHGIHLSAGACHDRHEKLGGKRMEATKGIPFSSVTHSRSRGQKREFSEDNSVIDALRSPKRQAQNKGLIPGSIRVWNQAADEDGFDAICDSLSPLNTSDRTSSEQTRPIPPHMPISKAGYVGTLQHASNSSDYIETSPAGNWKQSNGPDKQIRTWGF